MLIEKSPTVGCRSDLARLCNALGIKVAAEIGTDRGAFALEFLSKWDGELLYCVDPYKPYPEMPWNRTGDMMLACNLLAHEARRVRLVKSTGVQMAVHLSNKRLPFPSFIYIDGSHDYYDVYQDIYSWWPLLKSGAILSGDDYDREHPGVMRAVDEFAEATGVTVHLTTDYDRGPSWFTVKA